MNVSSDGMVERTKQMDKIDKLFNNLSNTSVNRQKQLMCEDNAASQVISISNSTLAPLTHSNDVKTRKVEIEKFGG